MEPEAFLRPLLPYMAAFVERDAERRLALLATALSPTAEIRGPQHVFTGYAEVSEKIIGFQKNWPECRLVLAAGVITFQNTCHFPMAIVGQDGRVLARGHSVAELASEGRIQRIVAYWGEHPSLPESWPPEFKVPLGAGTESAA
ncbi:MAG: nuclear transport factor 2 family protein [Piscinibacter sp.]|uniref:nuclear transport factor 2 family protein n=1 Tax=Piscinibacter sp. TaxID=1903157 RepID=UPI00258E0949|nr:nuclear transport factor 2 family protein [Piscinibacter sp.]MCW5664636.1 nuclear transport factor 2 family protein [Piscinibacter sp.]